MTVFLLSQRSHKGKAENTDNEQQQRQNISQKCLKRAFKEDTITQNNYTELHKASMRHNSKEKIASLRQRQIQGETHQLQREKNNWKQQ